MLHWRLEYSARGACACRSVVCAGQAGAQWFWAKAASIDAAGQPHGELTVGDRQQHTAISEPGNPRECFVQPGGAVQDRAAALNQLPVLTDERG
jgi:hypothetical protein